MKKKILIPLAGTALLLSACNGGSSSPTQLKVKVLKPDDTPFESAQVIWCNGESCYAASTNANGQAVSKFEVDKELEYEVHLSLPQPGYAYNPNIYSQKLSDGELTITLSQVKTPKGGDGTQYNGYVVGSGVYEVTLNTADSAVYYSMNFEKPGNYKVESWIAADSFVIASAKDYGASYMPFENFSFDRDENVANNFSHTYEVTDDVFDATGKPNYGYVVELSANAPTTYYFNIERIGDIAKKQVVQEELQTTLVKEQDVSYNVGIKNVDLGEKHIAVKDNDGHYHLDSVDGDLIYANITNSSKYIFGAINDPMFENNLTFEQEDCYLSYRDVVRAYAQKANNLGVYPLNDELIALFRKIAKAQDYFGKYGFVYSAVIEEYPSYKIGADDDFLYLCGTYTTVGTEESPYQFDAAEGFGELELNLPKNAVYYINIYSELGDAIEFQNSNATKLSKVYLGVATELIPDEFGSIKYTLYPGDNLFAVEVNDGSAKALSIYWAVTLPDEPESLTVGTQFIELSSEGKEFSFNNSDVSDITYVITAEAGATITVDGAEVASPYEVAIPSYGSVTITLSAKEAKSYQIDVEMIVGVGDHFLITDETGSVNTFRAPTDGTYIFKAGDSTILGVNEEIIMSNEYASVTLNANDEIAIYLIPGDGAYDPLFGTCYLTYSIISPYEEGSYSFNTYQQNIYFYADKSGTVSFSADNKNYKLSDANYTVNGQAIQLAVTEGQLVVVTLTWVCDDFTVPTQNTIVTINYID